MSSRCCPGALANALAELPVRIAALEVRQGSIAVADYPGGWRPTSLVCLSGQGHSGFGENVAFSAEEHARFVARVPDWHAVLASRAHVRAERVAGVLSSFPASSLTLHERAALEAATIDLGMRQAGLSFRDLTGIAAAELRFVRSFAASADPLAPIHRLRARGYTGGLKIDVDGSWDRAICERLCRESGVAILDFKGRGDIHSAQALSALFPAAIFEDPPAGTVHGRVSRDAVLGDTHAVAEALARGEAVNLKAPRMGGPLAVLRALELARARASAAPSAASDGRGDADVTGVTAYLGGMFEVSVGRAQARQLAALYCSDAPNDLALNVDVARGVPGSGVVESSPMESPPATVRLDLPGFGGICFA